MNFSCSRTGDLLTIGRTALLALLIAVSGIVRAEAAEPVPRVDRIVVVILENRVYTQIIRNEEAPFINELAGRGAMFVNSRAIRRPSQPNYLALFSGSTQGVKDDRKYSFDAPTLATALAGRGKSFAGYAEKRAKRKHKPWETFKGQAFYGQDMSQFPGQFDRLPNVSFVIPDDSHNMHSGSVRTADAWLKERVGGYLGYCRDHRCLLILTFDEPSRGKKDTIPTIIAGSQVKAGMYAQRIDHYSVLWTIADAMGVEAPGESAKAKPIFGIWTTE